MALHDFKCSACGHIERDHNVPIEIGAKAGRPVCPKGCEWPDDADSWILAHDDAHPENYRVRMDWIPKVGRMDAYGPFQEFQASDCYGKPVLVESMADIRKIERESEREYDHGERAADGSPLAQKQVWRDYSQDASNKDVHTFAKHPDRAMTDQTDRIEADPRFAGKRLTEGEAEKMAGKNTAFSAGDQLGEQGQ